MRLRFLIVRARRSVTFKATSGFRTVVNADGAGVVTDWLLALVTGNVGADD